MRNLSINARISLEITAIGAVAIVLYAIGIFGVFNWMSLI